MWKNIILVVFVALSIPAFSQNDLIILQNKVSVNLFSYMSRPVINHENDNYVMLMHGLMYTRQITFNRYVRVRFDYFQRNIDHSIVDEGLNDLHLYSDIQMGAGFVQGFGDKLVKPYLAGDLLFASALIYSETGGRSAGIYEKIQVRELGVTFLPAAGLTIRVSRIVSFSLETSLEAGYVHEKGTDFTWSADGIPYNAPVGRSSFFMRWDPVSLLAFELSF